MNKLPEIEFLESLTDFGIKLGLDKTIFLLKKFGNPHLKYPSILIGGTNGKGSVAKTLSEILKKAGYKVGLYTSPHLISVNERISINNAPIPQDDLIVQINNLKKVISKIPYHNYPTFFEALTVIGFSYFAERKVDVLVAEVGMGGRFDATNVLPSFLEVITKISLEHTMFLGKTLSQIAYEKAGIIKEKSKVICASQEKEVYSVIRKRAKEERAKLVVYGKDFSGKRVQQSPDAQTFHFYGKKILKNLKTPLLGKHQIENVSLAIQSAMEIRNMRFKLPEESIYSGVESVFWPARFQILRKNPVIVLDGAHNPAGIKALKNSLRELFPGERFAFLIGILKDKDWEVMMKEIFSITSEIIFTNPDEKRGISPYVLSEFAAGKKKNIKISILPEVEKAFEEVQKSKKPFCICGSLYLAGKVLKQWSVVSDQ